MSDGTAESSAPAPEAAAVVTAAVASPTETAASPASPASPTSDGAHVPAVMKSVKAVGIAADRNARHRRKMEDAHLVVDSFAGDESCGYFAIYDGHGGRSTVDFVVQKLHENFLEALKDPANSVEAAWKASYMKIDEQLIEAHIMMSGCTSVTALIRKEERGRMLYVANVGDARAVVSHAGTAERLTYEHKATDPDEIKRVNEAGAFVIAGRVNGLLAVTRALGDCSLKPSVTGEPYTKTIQLTDTDDYLILACDGVWDVCTDEEAVALIRTETDVNTMAKKLLVHALKSGSTDNISVMVIQL